MNNFNAEEYWKDKLYKTWVVTLRKSQGRKVIDIDTKYIRARTKGAAIETAKYHTLMTGKLTASCRLATPTDLGCVETPVYKLSKVA